MQTLKSYFGRRTLERLRTKKKLEENSILKNLEFRNVGPTTMSGRVTDIDNPIQKNPTEFYGASGGLWYTNNNGTTFTPIFDREAVMTIFMTFT